LLILTKEKGCFRTNVRKTTRQGGKMFFGLLLILIGLIFLLKQLGILSGSVWGVIWPALLIIWGLVILTRKGKGGCWMCGGKQEKKMEVNL